MAANHFQIGARVIDRYLFLYLIDFQNQFDFAAVDSDRKYFNLVAATVVHHRISKNLVDLKILSSKYRKVVTMLILDSKAIAFNLLDLYFQSYRIDSEAAAINLQIHSCYFVAKSLLIDQRY